MRGIQKTNRTILFDQFNGESADLMTLLSTRNHSVSLNDNKVKEINEKLLVKSFDEFLEKFSPTLYAFLDVNSNEMKYAVSRPEGVNPHFVQEIPLGRQHDFMKMLFMLLDEREKKNEESQEKAARKARRISIDEPKNQIKASSESKYLRFEFESILDFISPTQKAERIKTIQQDFLRKFEHAVKQEEEIQKKLLAECEDILAQLTDDYQHILSFIPLAMEDIEYRLFPHRKRNMHVNPIAAGIQSMPGEEVNVLHSPDLPDVNIYNMEEEAIGRLTNIIVSSYREQTKIENEYVENVILRSYGIPTEDGYDEEILISIYNQYMDFYNRAQENFFYTVKPVIERIIGVKLFFDQSKKIQGKDSQVELVVTNVENSMWIERGLVHRLEAYLSSVNTKTNYDNTIWFAIFPSVICADNQSKKITRLRFQGNEKRNTDVIERNLDYTIHLMKIVSDFRIQCFYGFESTEQHTFAYVAENGISHFVEQSRPLLRLDFREYLIPCYPNFTLVPKEKSFISMGSRLKMSEDNQVVFGENRKTDMVKLWMGGIYIQAVFVAAGIVAAYQSPDYLKTCFKKGVDDELPGVRYNIERKNHFLHTAITLSREISGFKQEVIDEVEEKSFGFMFSSEASRVNGKNIPYMTVWKARSLMYQQRAFEPIFQILTANYIKRIIRYDTVDYKKDGIIKFFSSSPGSRRNMWMSKRTCVNAILADEDTMTYHIDEAKKQCTLEVMFEEQLIFLEIELNTMS